MIAIVDYGVGNLFSLKSSLDRIGEKSVVTGSEKTIIDADKVILPGVGAFGDAAEKLRETGLDKAVTQVADEGKPLLGICLGMQLLLEKSFEFGEHKGLGLIKGEVKPIDPFVEKGAKIPQMGWNSLNFTKDCPIFKYIRNGEYVYFVHSYHGTGCGSDVAATVDYFGTLTAAVSRKNVFGCQFHPEKSGDAGLSILKAFCSLTEAELC